MTDAEAIEAVRRGERAATRSSLVAELNVIAAMACYHSFRVIACDSVSDTDVIECHICGLQRLAACNFDDDMA